MYMYMYMYTTYYYYLHDSYRPAYEVKLAIEERDPIKIAKSCAVDDQLATTDELEVSKGKHKFITTESLTVSTSLEN